MQMTTEIVTAFASNNIIDQSDLQELIKSVHQTLAELSVPQDRSDKK